jgi:hypothetical protein
MQMHHEEQMKDLGIWLVKFREYRMLLAKIRFLTYPRIHNQFL